MSKLLRVTKVLGFRIVLRICYKLSWVYLGTKKAVKIGSELEAPAEGLEKKPSRVKCYADLSSLLEAKKVALQDLDRAMEACFLQKHLWFWEESILMVIICMKV